MKRFSLIAALALVGCAQPGPKPLYQWEGYQPALYEHLKDSGADPGAQIVKLEAQLQKNAAAGAANPPGLHAHLALLYSKMGNDDAARQHLRAEQAQFPESSGYVDFLLKNRGAQPATAPQAAPAAPASAAAPSKT